MLSKDNVSYSSGSTGGALGISNEAMQIYSWVVYTVVCQIINIFGIITNVINIICFVKQGFEDSINISLLGLSVSDLCSLITAAWTCVTLTPSMLSADLPFDPAEVSYLVSAIPHFTFTRVSSSITAMITLERCLCITYPLKIHTIITPKRTTVITICIFIALFIGASPVYVVNTLGKSFSLRRNKTLLGLVFTENSPIIEKISFIINNFFMSTSSCIIIIVCTAVLSFKLKSITEWRNENSTQGQAEKVSSRNQKAAKMVVTISTLFIICFVPMSVVMLAFGFLPSMAMNGENFHISILTAGGGYILEAINSSMNIFIYYNMSSKYREIYNKFMWGVGL